MTTDDALNRKSGDELNRRYHELCGWQYGTCVAHCAYSHWHDPNDPSQIAKCRTFVNILPPPLHLDANLAITEADRVFVKWDASRVDDTSCGNTGVHFTFGAVWADDFNDVCGVTFCEAVLRALLAAKENK